MARLVGLVVVALAGVLAVTATGPVDAAEPARDASRADPLLWRLYEERAAQRTPEERESFRNRTRLVRVVGGRVVVDAVADGDVRALEADLLALGARNIAAFGRVVSAEVPISAVPALDALATLRFVRPSVAVRRRAATPRTSTVAPRAGPVTSEGDRAMRADAARELFGVTGAGVQVGVLSDSFDCLDGAGDDLATGDLSSVTVLEELSGCEDGNDEGRAMLHIVHDVAPGASLTFASGANGMASLAGNIVKLREHGATVIVDDVQYFDEPMFQDGIVAQAVDTVVARGAAYFSSAGNEGRDSYESPFREGPTLAPDSLPSAGDAPRFRGGVAHRFAGARGADHLQRITIPTDVRLIVVLQWDSPFFSVSGPPGSPNDLDVYLLDAAGTRILDGAVTDNVGRDAVEMFDFVNEGATADFNLMIVRYSGASPGVLKYVQEGDRTIKIAEDATRSSTVFGHNQAVGATAVGAANWLHTPAFGISPPRLEPYSSAGPVRILFDAGGRRLDVPIVRAKPEIVAPDDVTTSVAGFEDFPGTSAAAPHAAGVAALVRQQRPDLSPAAVYKALADTALDMAGPGVDASATGAGLIQADAALHAVSTPRITVRLTLNRQSVAAGEPVQIGLSVSNTGTSGLRDVYLLALVPPALSTALGCPAGDAILAGENALTRLVPRCAGSTPLQSVPAVARSLPFPAGGAPALLTAPVGFVWPAGLPPGDYTWIVLITPPAAFADGSVDPGDVDAVAFDSLQGSG